MVLTVCIIRAATAFVVKKLADIKTVSIDSMLAWANGNIWHKDDIKKQKVPSCGNIDTDARWGKSATKGWIFSYGIHALVSTGKIIIPLNADVVSANVPDNKLYPKLTASLPKETKFITGDAGYDDNKLKEYEKKREKKLITPVEVKKHTKKERRKEAEFFNSKEGRAIYKNRSITIEPFFGQIQEIFALSDKLPVKHLDRVKTLVLTCIFTFQCAVYFNIINDYSPMRVKHLIWSM